MGRKISNGRALYLIKKDEELRQMQRDGKNLPKSKRHNRHLKAHEKRESFIGRIRDRILRDDGKMPLHLKEKKEEKDGV